MKRSSPAAVLVLICGGAALIGQTTALEAYREAYDAWRQAHPDLERNAGTGGTALVTQADRAASAAAAFGANRLAYQKSASQDAAKQRQFLQAATTRPAPELAPPVLADLVTGQLQTVTRAIARFANDADSGIQQLRQSLSRERDALAALNESIQLRQKAVMKTTESAAGLEQARTRTSEEFSAQTSRVFDAAGQLENENAAWAAYYEKLGQTIQVASAPPPRVNIAPVPARNDSAPTVPLARYVGAWTYPVTNGVYHGAQPEFVDLVVHEQNGHADGTLFGRFKLAPGSTGDPLIRFDFQGDFIAVPNQRFTLVTSDGAHGTVELIPGPAFNLLEVNFQTDPRPGKLAVGNFILVKK